MQLFVFEGLNCMDKQTFTIIIACYYTIYTVLYIYYSVFKNLTLSVWNAHCTLMFMPANICTSTLQYTNVQCTYVQRSKPCSPLFLQTNPRTLYSTVHFAHSNQSLYIVQCTCTVLYILYKKIHVRLYKQYCTLYSSYCANSCRVSLSLYSLWCRAGILP